MTWSITDTDPGSIAKFCHVHAICCPDEATARVLAAQVFAAHPEIKELALSVHVPIHPTGSITTPGEQQNRLVGAIVGGQTMRRIILRHQVLPPGCNH